ncbi:MAG: ATP-binding cassette domain-containing protein, partial [Dehalococcoidia bacterium]|nr:ATP-binding cassette domain-containing protein [Dehalococcoidia bacterium]
GFAYEPGAEPVLRDLSFEVRKGEVVAVVGPSGAGKTTLVDLLPRFYEPTSGRISVDGGAAESAVVVRFIGSLPLGRALRSGLRRAGEGPGGPPVGQ